MHIVNPVSKSYQIIMQKMIDNISQSTQRMFSRGVTTLSHVMKSTKMPSELSADQNVKDSVFDTTKKKIQKNPMNYQDGV